MNEEELCETAVIIGKKIIQYGGELYRAEESITRICAAYGHSTAEVFAIPSYITASVYRDGDSQITRIISVPEEETNLDRVGEYNALCRRMCCDRLPYDTVLGEIERIENRPVYGSGVQLAGYLAVGFSFAVFFGGDDLSAVFAAAAAGIIFFMTKLTDRIRGGVFFRNTLCSAAAALFALTLYHAGIDYSYDKTITGAIMTMVPGVSITNCMRNFISGDLLSGLYTMAEAFTSAVGLAVGAGSVMSFFGV